MMTAIDKLNKIKEPAYNLRRDGSAATMSADTIFDTPPAISTPTNKQVFTSPLLEESTIDMHTGEVITGHVLTMQGIHKTYDLYQDTPAPSLTQANVLNTLRTKTDEPLSPHSYRPHHPKRR